MGNLKKYSDGPDANAPGLDLLRELAAYPHRAVQLSRRQIRSRVVLFDRDAAGNILRSTERIEESEFTDLDGQWFD